MNRLKFRLNRGWRRGTNNRGSRGHEFAAALPRISRGGLIAPRDCPAVDAVTAEGLSERLYTAVGFIVGGDALGN